MSETFYATKSFHGSDHSFPGRKACYPLHWLRLVPDTAKPFSSPYFFRCIVTQNHTPVFLPHVFSSWLTARKEIQLDVIAYHTGNSTSHKPKPRCKDVELNAKQHRGSPRYCAPGHHSMSSASESPFKPPPIVECVSGTHCLGIGKKIHVPHRVCSDCLQRHDPQQLRIWAISNTAALLLINEETARKHVLKRNIEARGRHLCAFEDPDFQHCRWRLLDLNLRGTRLDCPSVRRKGTACAKCWRRRLRKIGIVQHFTPAGLCHEEADRVATSLEGSEESSEGSDDDVEGYNVLLG